VNPVVQIQCASTQPVPGKDDIRRWIISALENYPEHTASEITVRLVDEQEMSALNETYRDKPGPTNVLSFPADLPEDVKPPILGDIVICAPVVRLEAAQQGKTETAHWAHMTVHGTLHLLGYDHVEHKDAEIMESLESAILTGLDYPCPYGAEIQREHMTP